MVLITGDYGGHYHLESLVSQGFLHLADAEGPEVKDRGGKDNAGAALHDGLVEVLQLAGPAGGHDGHGDDVGDGLREFEIVSGEGPVAVHARRQDHARPEGLALLGPVDGVLPHGSRAACDDKLEARGHGLVAPGVDGYGDLIGAVLFRRLPDKHRVLHGGAVHGNLACPGPENELDILQAVDSAPHGQRNVDDGRDLPDPFQPGFTVFHRCRDVQHGKLVGTFLLVEGGVFHGVTCIADVHEVHPLHDTAVFHVQARHDLDDIHRFLLVTNL